MKGLSLFRRTSNRGCWNVAAFHSPHSLTWSWILSFSLPTKGSGRWLRFHRWSTNDGRQWLLQLARCSVQWHRQRPMWYRDLYWKLDRKREEERVPRPADIMPLHPHFPAAATLH